MHKVKAGSGRVRPEKRTSTLPLPPSLQKEVLSAEDSTIVLGRLRNELVPLIKRWKEVCEEQQKYSNERKGAASEKAGENTQLVAGVEGGGIKGQEDVEGLRKQPHTNGRKRSRQSAGETNAKSSSSDNLAVVGLNEVLKALERREARLLLVACQRGLYGPSPVLYEQLRSLSNVSATPTLFLDCQPVMMGKVGTMPCPYSLSLLYTIHSRNNPFRPLSHSFSLYEPLFLLVRCSEGSDLLT